MRNASRLDRALAVFAATSVLLAATVVAFTSRGRVEAEIYRIDERVELPPEVVLASPANLVVWIHTQCDWCMRALPSYKRLADGPRRGRVIVLGIEPVDALAAFLRAAGVEPDQLLSSEAAARRIAVTPTVLLVSAEGRLKSIWTGLTTKEAEAEIAAALR